MNVRKLSVNKACIFFAVLLLVAMGTVSAALYGLTQNITAVWYVLLFGIFVLVCAVCFMVLVRRKLAMFSDAFCSLMDDIQHSFDAFCKKVLRNEARDYQDALARKRNREVYFSELPVDVLEQFAVRDTYFTDSRTFEVIGHSVCIDDETLAEAISALPVDRRDIILLSYFLDMSDAEIANVLNMVRRSVAYRRTSTLKLLKNLMGGKNR